MPGATSVVGVVTEATGDTEDALPKIEVAVDGEAVVVTATVAFATSSLTSTTAASEDCSISCTGTGGVVAVLELSR